MNEPQIDFFKFMDETIKREEAKQKMILPLGKDDPKEPYNPNREYQKRYAHRVVDRIWLGPKRY